MPPKEMKWRELGYRWEQLSPDQGGAPAAHRGEQSRPATLERVNPRSVSLTLRPSFFGLLCTPSPVHILVVDKPCLARMTEGRLPRGGVPEESDFTVFHFSGQRRRSRTGN